MSRRITHIFAHAVVAVLLLGAGNALAEPPAEVLRDETIFHVRTQEDARLTVRRAIRVNRLGGQEYATIRIPESDYVRCRSMQAELLDRNGRRIQTADIDDLRARRLYGDFALVSDDLVRECLLASTHFPYEVHYEYTVDYRSLFFWPRWLPQGPIPVKAASYDLLVPLELQFDWLSTEINTSPDTLESEKQLHLRWVLARLAPSQEEAHAPPECRQSSSLLLRPEEFSVDDVSGSFTSWGEFGGWYRKLASDRYELRERTIERIRAPVSGCQSDQQRIDILYRMLQERTRYVAIEPGLRGWQPALAQDTYSRRYGDCKDLTTLMIAMLKTVDIAAYPALVRTATRGPIPHDFIYNCFNHAIVCIPSTTDTLWLECTADHLAPGELPAMDEGCLALVIDDVGCSLTSTPKSAAEDNLWVAEWEGELDAAGNLAFCASLNLAGNFTDEFRAALAAIPPYEVSAWVARRLAPQLPGLRVDDVSWDLPPGDSVSTLQFAMRGRVKLMYQRRGGLLTLKPACLAGEIPLAIVSDAPRRCPIYQPFPFIENCTIRLTVPEDWQLVDADEPPQMEAGIGSCQMNWQWDPPTLSMRQVLRLEQTRVPPEESSTYAKLQEAAMEGRNAAFSFSAQ